MQIRFRERFRVNVDAQLGDPTLNFPSDPD